MSNPYSSVSVSGYNASPPADDGSAVSANQVKWQTHLEKIGGPLKTALEAINTNVSAAMAFGLGFTFETKSADYTVLTTDQGKIIAVDTGAVTITLPAVADVGTGFPLIVLNTSTGSVIVDGNASETINGSPSHTLRENQWILITTDGAEWVGIIPGTDQTIVKNAVESKTVDTTLADDTELAGFTLVAGKHYEISGHIEYVQNVGDIKFKFDFSDAPTSTGLLIIAADDNDASFLTYETSAGNTRAITTLGDGIQSAISLSGTFQANATTGGTVDFQWAQNTSEAVNTSVAEGSWIRIRQLD